MQWFTSSYSRLPIFAQHLTCNIHGAYMNCRFFGAEYRKILDQYIRQTFQSPTLTRELRDQHLRNFIKHAVTTTQYYKRIFGESGLSPDDIRGLNDLAKIPILQKSDVQNFQQELSSSSIGKNEKIGIHTSGTTGAPLKIFTTRIALMKLYAVWGRYYDWHGVNPGQEWSAVFAARPWVDVSQKRPPFWRYNCIGRQILFSGFHLTQENIRYYIDELRKRKPPWIQGFPSLIVLLANHLLETKEDLGYPVKHVTFGAENVLSYQVDTVQQVFGVKPRQHYGLSEAVANISECELGQLHVDEDFSAVEFVSQADGTTRIIGTNFTNPAMPLIRYDTNDTVTLGEGRCPCGRPGRVVKEIDGRLEDYIVIKNGSRIAQMDSIFKALTNIRAAQFYQDRPGAFTLKIVKGHGYCKTDEQELLKRIIGRVGPETEVTFDYVDELERSRGGKIRLFINELSRRT